MAYNPWVSLKMSQKSSWRPWEHFWWLFPFLILEHLSSQEIWFIRFVSFCCELIRVWIWFIRFDLIHQIVSFIRFDSSESKKLRLLFLVRLLSHIRFLNPELTGDLRWNIPWYWTVLGTKRGPSKKTLGEMVPVVGSKMYSRWWFQIVLIFTSTWGNDPIWLIFFRWVETTN